MVRKFPLFVENEVVEVIEKPVNGIKVIRITDIKGDLWINLAPITKQHGYSKNAIRYHLYNLPKNLEANIKYYKKGNKLLLFLNRQVFNQLRYLVPRFRTSELIEQTAKLYTELETGELKVIDQEGVAKLKQQIQKPALGQDLSHIIARLDRIEQLLTQSNGLALPQKDVMDVPRKKIMGWLFDNAAKDFGVPGYEIWWDFSSSLRIDNYGKQPKSMFPEMLRFFFEIDPKLVVRAHNWYKSTPEPKEDILQIFLLLFDPKQASLNDFSEDELSDYT